MRQEGLRDVIELRVELDGSVAYNEVAQVVRGHLRQRFADFWQNYEMRLYEFRVVPVARESLRPGRKLKRVLDERQMALHLAVR